MTRPPAAVALLCILLSVSACNDESKEEVLVSAAASLTDVFTEIEKAYEMAHPEVDVVLNFGGSSTLREQILEGAPVDVFASANQANMDAIVGAGMSGDDPVVFARNLLQIAVPPGNPAGVTGLEDLARDDLLIGLCAAEVPCGDIARRSLADAGIVAAIDTNEPDVRALLTKIEAGELDAGIVYVTDVASAGHTVEGLEISEDVNVVTDYPIAVIADALNPVGGDAFVEFVLSDSGHVILADHGFDVP